MKKQEFIEDVNNTINGINLTDDNIEYIYKDTSNLPAAPAAGPLTAEVTITYNGKTKTYPAENNTSFPKEFIDDYDGGYYSKE